MLARSLPARPGGMRAAIEQKPLSVYYLFVKAKNSNLPKLNEMPMFRPRDHVESIPRVRNPPGSYPEPDSLEGARKKV